MNPFKTLDQSRRDYRAYVESFQRFRNPHIREFVRKGMDEGDLLWREPLIQISRQFKPGTSLEQLAEGGKLHKKCLNVFRSDLGNPSSPPITPYFHQTEAFRIAVEEGHNFVVATGTGSGKSFCFGIPVVHTCLQLHDKAVEGIKAVFVYPMNALANSQYIEFAERLAGSGLRIALYTGDTDYEHSKALENYRRIFPDRDPLDSEVLSREEIRENPPDILVTNYVMLELALTRLDDRKVFRKEHHGALHYLVLDELHTYGGKRGADVSCLIRRLKQRTGSMGKLRCIGASATMQSEEGGSTGEAAARFAERLFGESFRPEDVIQETEVELPAVELDPLPLDITVAQEALDAFSEGDITTAVPLAEALLGRELYCRTIHDVVTLRIPRGADGDEPEFFAATLQYALSQAIALHLDLEESEIGSFVMPDPRRHCNAVVIYERSEGGTGILEALTRPKVLQNVAFRALDLIHCDPQGADLPEACKSACYDCLCSFYNQRQHTDLDRHLIRDFLVSLTHLSDLQSEGAADAFQAMWDQCNKGERVFLQIIKDEGLRLPDAVHKVIHIDGTPTIEADFFYAPLDIVLVHGSIHHQQYVQIMDADKEDRVKAAGYRVVTLDPTDPDAAKRRLRSTIHF